MSYFYNNMLTNPTTFLRNIIGNATMLTHQSLHRVATRPLLDFMANKVFNKPRTYYLSDGTLFFKGVFNNTFNLKRSLPEMKRAMGRAWRGGIATEEVTKFDEQIGSSILNAGGGVLGGDVDQPRPIRQNIERFMNTGTASLVGMDIWFKHVAYQAFHGNSKIRLERISQQPDGAKQLVDEVRSILKKESKVRRETERELSEILTRVAENRRLVQEGATLTEKQQLSKEKLTADLIDVLAKAETQRFEEHMTFQDAPGSTTRGIIKALNHPIPLFANTNIRPLRGFVPFINTLANITKRGLEFIPVPGVTRLFESPLSRQELLAKQVEGAIIGLVLYQAFAKGLLVGSPPDDPEERRQFFASGKLPWSFIWNGQYISFREFEPFGTPLAMIATLFDQSQRAPEDNALDVAIDLMFIGKNFFMDSTYLSGLGDLFGPWGGSAKDHVKHQLGRTSSNFLPFSAFTRTLTNAAEFANTGQVTLKEHESPIGYWTESDITRVLFSNSYATDLAVALGLATREDMQVRDRLDVFGDTIVRSEGIGESLLGEGKTANYFREWLPIRTQPVNNDPVENAFDEVGYYPRPPSKTYKRRGVLYEIPDDIYRGMVIDMGTRLRQRYNAFVGGVNWERLTIQQKDRRLRRARNQLGESSLRRIRGEMNRRIHSGSVVPRS
jgi:hypothetical protein